MIKADSITREMLRNMEPGDETTVELSEPAKIESARTSASLMGKLLGRYYSCKVVSFDPPTLIITREQ